MRRSSLLLSLLCAACGSSGPGAAGFIGTFSSTGTDSWTGCANIPTAVSGTTTLTIVAGPSAGQITTQQQNCDLNWNVSGSTATLIAGQTCSGTTADGTTYTVTYTTGTSTLSSDGDTITAVLQGSQVFTNSAGSETCTLSQGGTATRTTT